MGRKKATLTKDYYMKFWLDRLTNLAVNMFEWQNLPKEINQAQMEKDIMLGAFSIFFKDKDTDKFICLPGALSGVDIYGYPTVATPIPKNGIVFPSLKIGEDAVVIYANRIRTSALQYINDYADRLSDIDIAIKMNTLAMKHPIVVTGSESTKDSVETMMKQYEDNYYLILTDKGLASSTDISVANLKVDAMEILNLQKEKETVLNEFYQSFGVSGSVEKRERIISGEMNAMMQQVGINRKMWLSYRQESCKEINRLFGLTISVDATMIDFSIGKQNQEQPKEKKEEEQDNEM